MYASNNVCMLSEETSHKPPAIALSTQLADRNDNIQSLHLLRNAETGQRREQTTGGGERDDGFGEKMLYVIGLAIGYWLLIVVVRRSGM